MSTRLRAVLTLVALLLAAGWTMIGLGRLQVDSEIESMLPAGDPAVQALDSMARAFGGDPVVVIIEGSGDPLSAGNLPRLLELEGALSGLDDVVATYGPATTLNQVALRIKQMMADLSGRRDALMQAGATRQLRSFESRYGALLVQAMPAGLPTLSNMDFVRSVVTDPATGRPSARWQQYLPVDDTAAIYLRPREGLDAEASEELVSAVRAIVGEAAPLGPETTVTVSGAPVVASGVADRLRVELPRLAATAFVVVGLILFLVPWTANKRWRLTPLLVMVTATAGTLACFGWRGEALSLGAATFLPVILGLGSYYPAYLALQGHRRVVLAVASSSVLAYAALLISPLPFVRELGFAVPVGLTLVVLLSLLAQWAWPLAWQRPDLAIEPRTGVAMARRRTFPRGAVIGVALIALCGSAVGWSALAAVELRTDPQQMLSGVPALDEAVDVERILGHGGEIDIRLTGDDVVTPEALAWSRKAEERLATRFADRLRPVVTVAELYRFLGDQPTPEQVQAGSSALPAYVRSAVVSADGTQALASFGVTWADLADDRSLVADVIDALPPAPAGYDVVVSGLPVAAARGYDLVDGERYRASMLALGAAALALVILLPTRRDAVVALAAGATATGLTVAVLVAVVGALNPLTLTLGALTAAVSSELSALLLAARRGDDAAMGWSLLLAVLLSIGGYGVLLTSSLPVLRELGFALTASVAISGAVAWAAVELIRRKDSTPPRRSAQEVQDAHVHH